MWLRVLALLGWDDEPPQYMAAEDRQHLILYMRTVRKCLRRDW